MAERTQLFRNHRYAIEHVAGPAGRTRLVICFSFHGPGDLDAPGFGEDFLVPRGFDLISVKTGASAWYQDLSFEMFQHIVAPVCETYSHVSLYGTSMEGYAALYYSGAVKAQRVLAISPQASVDPKVVPWETRWQPDRRLIHFRHAPLDQRVSAEAEKFVLYDPVNIDKRHVDWMAARDIERVSYVPLYFGGHPVMEPLRETRALSGVALGVLNGSFTARQVRRRLRDAGRQAPTVAINLLSWRLARRGILDEELLARIEAQTLSALNCRDLSRVLARAARREDAERYARAAVDGDPTNPHFWTHLSNVERANGQPDAALLTIIKAIELANEAIMERRTTPRQVAYLYRKTADLYRQLGDLENCETALRSAVMYGPQEHEFFEALSDVLVENGKVSEAIEAICMAIANAPNAARYHGKHSRILAGEGRTAESAAAARAACYFAPDNPHFHAQLANTLNTLGDFEAALHEIEAAIDLDPSIAYFYRTKAILHRRLGQHEEAWYAIHDAVERDPDNKSFTDLLEQLRAMFEQREETSA